jgi:hypothetical protein
VTVLPYGSGRQGQNIFIVWFFEPDLGVFMALTRDRSLIVPVLEYDKIGQDGDFTGPFTYTLEVMDRFTPRPQVHVSRNKVPAAVKDYFRAFYRSKEKKREGVKQEEVGLAPAKEAS